MNALWITITIIGVATYAARVVPLLWLRPNGQERLQSSLLNRLVLRFRSFDTTTFL